MECKMEGGREGGEGRKDRKIARDGGRGAEVEGNQDDHDIREDEKENEMKQGVKEVRREEEEDDKKQSNDYQKMSDEGDAQLGKVCDIIIHCSSFTV